MLYMRCFPSYKQDYIFHEVAPANIEFNSTLLFVVVVSTILLSVLRLFLLFLKRKNKIEWVYGLRYCS